MTLFKYKQTINTPSPYSTCCWGIFVKTQLLGWQITPETWKTALFSATQTLPGIGGAWGTQTKRLLCETPLPLLFQYLWQLTAAAAGRQAVTGSTPAAQMPEKNHTGRLSHWHLLSPFAEQMTGGGLCSSAHSHVGGWSLGNVDIVSWQFWLTPPCLKLSWESGIFAL